MEPVNPDHFHIRRAKQLQFAGIYICSFVLLVLVFFSFWRTPLPASAVQRLALLSAAPNNALAQSGEQLYHQLQQLQQLDEQYLTAMKDSTVYPPTNTMAATENACRKTIDSLEQVANSNKAGAEKERLQNMIGSSKLVLQQHQLINSLYSQASIHTSPTHTASAALLA